MRRYLNEIGGESMLWYDILIRLALAIFVGGLIGYEREYTNRPAGFRTHILVCVGAAVATMVEISMTNDTIKMILANPTLGVAIKTDMGRFGAQVITGIGFLGAGTILHEKGSIKGLTTAASIWVVACIGLAVGSGYYFLSISSAIGVYIVLVGFKKIEDKYIDKFKIVNIEIQFKDKVQFVKDIEDYFDSKKIKVKSIEFVLEENSEEVQYKKCIYSVLIARYFKTEGIIQELYGLAEIINVTKV